MTMINRANRYYCGDYQEVSIVAVIAEEAKRGNRKYLENKEQYLTRPEQQVVNDRNTFKYMRLALQGNFKRGDLFLTLTFKASEIPSPDKLEEAKYTLTKKFLRKLRERYQKENEQCKYIWVMEYELDDEGNYLKRVHFHVVINKIPSVSIEEVEDYWSVGRGKNKKALGRVYTKRLLPSPHNGLEDLALYLSKGKRWKKGKKLWNSSRNLERPKRRKRDKVFSHRQMAAMAMSNDKGAAIIAKKYPNHHITDIHFKYTDYRGWHLYLKMWKKERAG